MLCKYQSFSFTDSWFFSKLSFKSHWEYNFCFRHNVNECYNNLQSCFATKLFKYLLALLSFFWPCIFILSQPKSIPKCIKTKSALKWISNSERWSRRKKKNFFLCILDFLCVYAIFYLLCWHFLCICFIGLLVSRTTDENRFFASRTKKHR